jgi:hypothetical protein
LVTDPGALLSVALTNKGRLATRSRMKLDSFADNALNLSAGQWLYCEEGGTVSGQEMLAAAP